MKDVNDLKFSILLLRMAQAKAAADQQIKSQRLKTILENTTGYACVDDAIGPFEEALEAYTRATIKVSQVENLCQVYAQALSATSMAKGGGKKNPGEGSYTSGGEDMPTPPDGEGGEVRSEKPRGGPERRGGPADRT